MLTHKSQRSASCHGRYVTSRTIHHVTDGYITSRTIHHVTDDTSCHRGAHHVTDGYITSRTDTSCHGRIHHVTDGYITSRTIHHVTDDTSCHRGAHHVTDGYITSRTIHHVTDDTSCHRGAHHAHWDLVKTENTLSFNIMHNLHFPTLLNACTHKNDSDMVWCCSTSHLSSEYALAHLNSI